MGLLTPFFLLGLGALAVPFIVHLVQRDRKAVVEFPSLMFLRRIPFQATRRHKLRRLLLLALRCLAIAIIVAAFARPFVERRRTDGRLAAGAAGGRELVILFDRSYSMAYGGRWARARDAARKVIGGMRAGDRATLVSFGSSATELVAATNSIARLERAVATLEPSGERTRFAPGIRLAAQVIEKTDRASAEVVVISDFHRSSWARREELALPPGTTLRAVDVSQREEADVAVASVATERRGEGDAAAVTVEARLVNLGSQPRDVAASLDVGGRTAQSVRVTVPAHGAARATFTPVRVAQRPVRGSVRITADSLTPDDVRYFVVAPGEAVRVLVIEPPGSRGAQSLYLTRALTLATNPRVELTIRTAGAAREADIDGRTLFIFNEAPPPGGVLGRRIRDVVESGGGVLFVPGERGLDLPLEWRTLLPADIGGVVDRAAAGGGSLSFIDQAHPVFEIFRESRSGDFAAARVHRERALTPRKDAAVLARFDDGAPALVEATAGRGRALVWGTTLDSYWTDLPLHPVFLPFMHRLASYAARQRFADASLTVGDALDVTRIPDLARLGDLVLESPTGKLMRLSIASGTTVAALREQGFYELRGPASAVGSGRPIAVNVDPSEADLSHFDPAELVAAAGATPSTSAALKPGITPLSSAEMERRQTLWWYLLLAALIALAAETVLSNRYSARRAGGTT